MSICWSQQINEWRYVLLWFIKQHRILFQIRPVYHNGSKVQVYDGRGLSKCNLLCWKWLEKSIKNPCYDIHNQQLTLTHPMTIWIWMVNGYMWKDVVVTYLRYIVDICLKRLRKTLEWAVYKPTSEGKTCWILYRRVQWSLYTAWNIPVCCAQSHCVPSETYRFNAGIATDRHRSEGHPRKTWPTWRLYNRVLTTKFCLTPQPNNVFLHIIFVLGC